MNQIWTKFDQDASDDKAKYAHPGLQAASIEEPRAVPGFTQGDEAWG